jgi:hypothetical protein
MRASSGSKTIVSVDSSASKLVGEAGRGAESSVWLLSPQKIGVNIGKESVRGRGKNEPNNISSILELVDRQCWRGRYGSRATALAPIPSIFWALALEGAFVIGCNVFDFLEGVIVIRQIFGEEAGYVVDLGLIR